MTTKLRLTNPDEIEFELTVKMTLAQWRRLKSQLGPAVFPACDFSAQITDMIMQAEKTFYPEEAK